MKLLQNSWSEMLILDQIHQRMHNHLPDETTLPNGQKYALSISIMCLELYKLTHVVMFCQYISLASLQTMTALRKPIDKYFVHSDMQDFNQIAI